LKILATISVNPYFIQANKQDDHLKHSFPKYNDYFKKFMKELLELFKRDVNLKYEKGSLIIRELCVLLNPEDIYRMFSEILADEKDSEFAISMVDVLNSILLTSPELLELRNSLKDFNSKVSNQLIRIRFFFNYFKNFLIKRLIK
jgi:vacuole morphology and inheritance protein 14